jgi:methylmalonyl-CoA mutase N-terminal domain/subunit
MEEGQKLVVGVNAHKMNEPSPIKTLKIDEYARQKQIQRLRELKKTRDPIAVTASLETLRNSFEKPESNCIYPMLKAVKSYATLGEIVDVGRQVFGEWKEPSIL